VAFVVVDDGMVTVAVIPVRRQVLDLFVGERWVAVLVVIEAAVAMGPVPVARQ
jgi:hypothetical protein